MIVMQKKNRKGLGDFRIKKLSQKILEKEAFLQGGKIMIS